MNFERLDVDQSNIQPFRSPLKILTNVITKKRQDRHQSGTEQAISHNKSSEIGNGQIHGNRKCNSLLDRKEKKHVSLEAKRESIRTRSHPHHMLTATPILGQCPLVGTPPRDSSKTEDQIV